MTQADEILAWLKAGNTLTPLEALNKFGCMRLSGRIFDLRAAGHDIQSETVEVGEGKHVARYSMPAKPQFTVEQDGQMAFV